MRRRKYIHSVQIEKKKKDVMEVMEKPEVKFFIVIEVLF